MIVTFTDRLAGPACVDCNNRAFSNLRAWLLWASNQIDTSLAHDSDSRHCIARRVEPLAIGLGMEWSGAGSDQMAWQAAAQLHDRVVQQLCHVSDALLMLADVMVKSAPLTSWVELRNQQLGRFTMRDEQALFLRMVADTHPASADSKQNQEDTADVQRFE